MQAIRTRYHGPTNSRGSRIIAKCEGGSITMPYDHAQNLEGNHAAAARLLLERMGWPNVYFGGVFDRDYYWVSETTWAKSRARDYAMAKSEAA
jgi:hypothetical protein